MNLNFAHHYVGQEVVLMATRSMQLRNISPELCTVSSQYRLMYAFFLRRAVEVSPLIMLFLAELLVGPWLK